MKSGKNNAAERRRVLKRRDDNYRVGGEIR